MKILSAQQMKRLDAHNIETIGVSSIELMERAAKAVAVEIEALWSAQTKIVVFCGPGNNGGDGLAVARLLDAKDYNVEVFLFNPKSQLSDDCQKNKLRLQECNKVVLHEVTTQFDLPKLDAETLVVDALFGTGLSRPLSGGFQLLVEFINNCSNEVVSIDMPSGLRDLDADFPDGDTAVDPVVKANYTYTFHCMKPCMLLADNQQVLGKVKVLDIGLIEAGFVNNSGYLTTNIGDAKSMLIKRSEFGHKGTFGHGLLVAGSNGMCGAALLGAKAALRSGAGKITVHSARANTVILQTVVPEAIVSQDENDDCVTNININNVKANAVAFGPGVGQDDQTADALKSILEQKPERLIIDADGLNLLAKHPELIKILPKNTILTPHRKEMERLIGRKVSDRVMLFETMALCKKSGIYIVLKGHYTSVCTPQGKVYFNTTGNAGMATAGSGDVLTGVLLGLLAQGYDAETACRLGVWLHGRAGDNALEVESEESLTAGDVISCLGSAFKDIKN